MLHDYRSPILSRSAVPDIEPGQERCLATMTPPSMLANATRRTAAAGPSDASNEAARLHYIATNDPDPKARAAALNKLSAMINALDKGAANGNGGPSPDRLRGMPGNTAEKAKHAARLAAESPDPRTREQATRAAVVLDPRGGLAAVQREQQRAEIDRRMGMTPHAPRGPYMAGASQYFPAQGGRQ